MADLTALERDSILTESPDEDQEIIAHTVIVGIRVGGVGTEGALLGVAEPISVAVDDRCVQTAGQGVDIGDQ